MKEQTIQCEKCGHINEWGENFCANCGVRLQYSQPSRKPVSSPESLSKQTRSSKTAPPERLGPNLSRPAQYPQQARACRSGPEHLTNQYDRVSAAAPVRSNSSLKKSGKGRFAWIIGISISACAGLGVFAIVVITVFLLQPKILGNMTVTPNGGSFQQQAVTITASPGTVSIPLTFAISQLSDNSKPDEGVLAQTAPIQISGALDQMHGSLLVTLPIPSDWLAADGTLPPGETVEIVEQGQAFGTSVGVILDRHPLPTQIDLQAHIATVEVIFAPSEIASRSSPHLASPLRRDDYALTYRMLKIREEQFKCENQDFKIWAGFVPLSKENCQTLLDLLVDAKKKLGDLGFTDALTQHDRPIQIYLESLGSPYGYATIGSFSSVNSSYILLDAKKLKKGEDMDLSDPDKIQFIKSIIGHEMFHIVQNAYNPTLKTAWFPGMLTEQEQLKTLWSDEAMSVWFEPIAVGDPSYLPSIENGNLIELLTKPLAVPVKGKDSKGNESFLTGERYKGYGTAFFLHFLTNQYGNDLVKEILERQLSVSSAQPIAQVAWDQALRARGSSLSAEYVYFLEGFLIRRLKIHTDQFNNPIIRIEDHTTNIETVFVDVKLDADKVEEDREGAWYAVFTDRQQILIKSSERGYLKAGGAPAHTAIQIPLQNFLFKGVRLIVQESDLINSQPGTLGVKISCSGGSVSQACPDSIGLLAYPLPKGDEFVLPSYDGALSSADSYLYPGGDGEFLWKSNQFAAGKPYQGLYLIAFNNRLSTSDDPTIVTIDLYYIWDKQLEEPEPPTEEPQAEPVVLPTATPTPEPVIPLPPQPDEMSPEQACACVDRYFQEVQYPESLQYYKESAGSAFVSFEIVQQIPFTYNPSTGACEGHYAHKLCTNYPENPNSCQIVYNDWGNNPGSLNHEYPVDGPYYCSLLP